MHGPCLVRIQPQAEEINKTLLEQYFHKVSEMEGIWDIQILVLTW